MGKTGPRSEDVIGELNPNWRGNSVGYAALHNWVYRHKRKTKWCQKCKKVPPHDAANISGKYLRNKSDWEWLCRRCHMTKDGRLAGLIKRNKDV